MTKISYLLVSLLLFTGAMFAQDPSGSKTHSWDFEAGNANDVVGAADGTINGNVQVITTAEGDMGAELTGGTISLDAAAIGINTYEALSLETWFTPAGTKAGSFTMVAYLGGTQGGLAYSGFQIQPTRGTGNSRVAISCLNSTNPWTTEDGVDTNELDATQLYHVVLTIDSVEISYYVNGIFIGSDSLSGDNSIANLSNDLALLGSGGYTNDPVWEGTIHEVNIYNKALDLGEVTFLNTQGVKTGTPVTYVQNSDSLGLVVIQAEEYSSYKPGTGIKAGDEWVLASDTTGFLGTGYMQSVMTAGDGSITNAETVNAKLTYNVEFVHTGTHYLWARVYYPNGSGDSFWFGLDGVVNDRADQSNWGAYIWDEGNTSFEVDTAGMHTLDIMQREPGAIVDMIIVSRDGDFDPVTDSSWVQKADPMYNVVYVAPAASNDTVVMEAIEAYNNGETFGVTFLEKSVIDSTDLALLNSADVVVMGRNINSGDVGAAAATWDAIERPVMAMGLWGLRESRANWVPAGIGCENINGDTLVVSGIILNSDSVFGGLTDTIVWWNGSHSPFVPDSARIAAGNGTLMVESADLRPMFIRWNANQEFYPGAGHEPKHARSYMGIGNDNAVPANYFGFSEDAASIYFNELMRLAGMGAAPQHNVLFVTPSDVSLDAPVVEAIRNYNNGETFSVTVLAKGVIDSTDLARLNAADVVVMGRNIGSTDVATAAALWDSVRRPVLSMNMWGLRENRANWVPAGIGCENINGDTLVVNGNIQNTDAVFGGLSGNINWWNGSFSSFVVDTAQISAGNGTLMVESDDQRPLFIRWNAYEEFYPGAGHEPKHVRSFMGMGNDNASPVNYFGFSTDGATIFYNELMMLAGMGEAVDTSGTDAITLPIGGFDVKLYPNPASDLVNIESEVNIRNVRVMNIMGATLRVEDVNATETVLDMSEFSSGVYLVIVEGQKGIQSFKLRKL